MSGNYKNRRLEGMLNIPLLDDKVAVRVAGEWTKRDAIPSTTRRMKRPTAAIFGQRAPPCSSIPSNG